MLNSKRPHFLEVFLPNLSSEKLRVPLKFIRHMEGRTSGKVSLTGPSGNTWCVHLIKHNDDLYFRDGWPTFVRDHFIQCGDSLVFRYDGNLRFTVQIFDGSSCEKEEAFYARCSEKLYDCRRNTGSKRAREKEAASSHGVRDGLLKRMRRIFCPVMLECPTGKREPNSEICSSLSMQLKKLVMDGEDKQSACFNVTQKFDVESMKPVVLAMPALAFDHTSGSAHKGMPKKATPKEFSFSAFIEKTAAQHFTSCFPFFIRVMKSSNVSSSGTLKIPVQFSTSHLPRSRTNVVLQNLEGDRWTLSSIPTTKRRTMHTLCGGWPAFVRDNSIKIEDVCIFELIGNCEMRVRILRLGLEGLEGEKGGINRCAVGCSAFSSKTAENVLTKPKDNDPQGSSEGTEKLQICDQREANMSMMTETLQEAALPPEMKDATSSKSSVSPAHCTLSEVLNKETGAKSKQSNRKSQVDRHVGESIPLRLMAEETKPAKSFTSPFPNFVKVIKNSNIRGSHMLKIPSKFSIAHLPLCRTRIILRNLKGESWIVNSVITSAKTVGHALCGGWISFVRGNDVKLGDICLFELVGKGELLVRIFGVEQSKLECPSHPAVADKSTVDANFTKTSVLPDA
ncbi:hypothetical protein Ancab_028903 [Ancistrocladus abbreviatus]